MLLEYATLQKHFPSWSNTWKNMEIDFILWLKYSVVLFVYEKKENYLI